MSLSKNPSSSPTKAEKIEPIIFEDFNDEFDPNSGWIKLLYGAAGAGKTWYVGTALNSLYLDTGGGTDTLKSPLFKSKYPSIRRKSVKLYETWDGGLVKKAKAFDRTCDAIDQFLNTPELREFVKTLIIDDATALRAHALLRGVEIQDQNKDENKRRKLNRYVHTDMADIGREMRMIDWFLTQYIPIFRGEGINFILTAHERQIYGKASKMGDDRPLIAIKPGFSGQTFPDDVPKHFDEVWHIEKKSNKNGEFSQIKTGGSGNVLTKTRRAGVFAQYEINKSFEELLQQRKENKLHPSYTR